MGNTSPKNRLFPQFTILYIRGNPKIRFKIDTFMIYALIVTMDATPLPEQTKIFKNTFKRTIGNRDYHPFTFMKKTQEVSFFGQKEHF
ncbi:unnamed protein product [Rotaria socialis]